MKKIIFSAFLAVVIMSGTLLFNTGDSAEAEGTEYKYEVLNESAKTARVTQIVNPSEDIRIPAKINGYKIVEVGNFQKIHCDWKELDGPDFNIGDVFNEEDRAKVKRLYIPEGVLRIGNQAFRYCANITTVSFPASLYHVGSSAFNECSSLKEVTLGKKLQTIGCDAFYGCINMEKLVILSDKVIVGTDAFESTRYVEIAPNTKLTSIILPKVFYGKLLERCFMGYSGTSFVWPDIRGEEPVQVFDYANNLSKVTFPNRIKNVKIGQLALHSKKRIKQLIIPAGAKTVNIQFQGKLIDRLIITGEKTDLFWDAYLGEGEEKYLGIKEIIAPYGSKTEKIFKKWKWMYPVIDDWSGGCELEEAYNESKKITFKGVFLPDTPKVTVKKKKTLWKKEKGVKQYEIYYSRKKKGTYQKLAITKKTSYRLKKKGYIKVQAVKMKYGANWKSDFSKAKKIS